MREIEQDLTWITEESESESEKPTVIVRVQSNIEINAHRGIMLLVNFRLTSPLCSSDNHRTGMVVFIYILANSIYRQQCKLIQLVYKQYLYSLNSI